MIPPALAAPGKNAGTGLDPLAAAERAESYAALARSTHDARWFGRAEALVEPWLGRADAPPRLLAAAADLAQQRHEFGSARALLDRAVAADPAPAARLQRANVELLLGDFDAARADCRAVVGAGEVLPGSICLASSATGSGSVARSRALLAALDRGGGTPPALAQWQLLTAADLALRDGDVARARIFLERAHALDPVHEETRARLASLLIAAGDSKRAYELTAGENVSAALLVARIRAASLTDAAEASAARRELDALLEVGRRRGTAAHLREEGELALHVDGDAARALALARRNFDVQKDTPDLRLFADAAIAAHDSPTLGYLRAWLAKTGFEDRVTAARLAGAGK